MEVLLQGMTLWDLLCWLALRFPHSPPSLVHSAIVQRVGAGFVHESGIAGLCEQPLARSVLQVSTTLTSSVRSDLASRCIARFWPVGDSASTVAGYDGTVTTPSLARCVLL